MTRSSQMADKGAWQHKFDDPIVSADGKQLKTVPKSERNLPAPTNAAEMPMLGSAALPEFPGSDGRPCRHCTAMRCGSSIRIARTRIGDGGLKRNQWPATLSICPLAYGNGLLV